MLPQVNGVNGVNLTLEYPHEPFEWKDVTAEYFPTNEDLPDSLQRTMDGLGLSEPELWRYHLGQPKDNPQSYDFLLVFEPTLRHCILWYDEDAYLLPSGHEFVVYKLSREVVYVGPMDDEEAISYVYTHLTELLKDHGVDLGDLE